MKKLLFILMLIVGISQASVVNPATCFTNYPWAVSTNMFWRDVDSTNHIIKQVMLTFYDRCLAAGQPNMGVYAQNFILSAGTKTNYIYSVNGTNVHPQLLLQTTQTVANTYPSFEYFYPKDAGNSGTGVTNGTGVVYVTREMLDKLNNGITSICPYYIQAGLTTNYFNVPSNGVYPDAAPVYNMPALLTDAGYTNNVSNLVYNAWGRIIGGDWNWQTQLPSNGVMLLSALDERAACLAQFKLVCIPAKSCTPFYYSERVINGAYMNTCDGSFTDYSETFSNSFAWRQTSTDIGYTPSIISSNNAWTNALPAFGSIYNNTPQDVNPWIDPNFYVTNNPADWPTNGWIFRFVMNGTIDIYRDNTNQGTWVVSDDPAQYDSLVDYWPVQINPGIPQYYDGRTIGTNLTLELGSLRAVYTNYTIPKSGYNTRDLGFSIQARVPASWSTKVSSVWTNGSFTLASNTFEQGAAIWGLDTVITSNLTTEVNDITITNVVDETNTVRTFDTWGKYATSNSIVTVHFTNVNESVPPWTNKTIDISSASITSIVSFSMSSYQETVQSYFDRITSSNGYWNGNAWGGQTNNGKLNYSNLVANVVTWSRTEVYTLKPNVISLYTNIPSMTTVWIVGGRIDAYESWKKDSRTISGVPLVWEWNEGGYTWDAESIIFPNPVETNRYTQMASYNTQIAATNGMIFYHDLYDNAKVSGYSPFYGSTHSRDFWGVSNAFFIIDYAFTNHF